MRRKSPHCSLNSKAAVSSYQNHEIAKVANLEVDPKSYWLYTNDPFDNRNGPRLSRSTASKEALRSWRRER